MTFNKTRIIRILAALIFIITLNFLIPRMMPGDPLILLIGEDAVLDPDTLNELRKELALDAPLWQQYIDYWGRVIRLDLGFSFHYNKNVTQLIFQRLPRTLALLLPATFFGALLGMILGALSGWKKKSPFNQLVTTLNLAIYSTPPYFLAMISLYLFSIHWNWVPLKATSQSGSIGDMLQHLILPIMVMTIFTTSRNFMIMRGSVLQEKDKWYVFYAQAKGISGNRLLFGHIFKNAALPMVTLIALDFGFLFSGALLVEIVFSINGMGTLIYDAILSRDYPLLQGILLIITLMVVLANLLAEVCYHWLDPRIGKQSQP